MDLARTPLNRHNAPRPSTPSRSPEPKIGGVGEAYKHRAARPSASPQPDQQTAHITPKRTSVESTSADESSGTIRADSTGALRQRLGFYDDALWKRLSSRRLEFIHSMGLNLRVASEQETAIAAVAQQLAIEFGYPETALPDFEKLVRVGVQSVRRNQRRPVKFKHNQEGKRSSTSPQMGCDSSAPARITGQSTQPGMLAIPSGATAPASAVPNILQLRQSSGCLTMAPTVPTGNANGITPNISGPPSTANISTSTPSMITPSMGLAAPRSLPSSLLGPTPALAASPSTTTSATPGPTPLVRTLHDIRSAVTAARIALSPIPALEYLEIIGGGLLRLAAGLAGAKTGQPQSYIQSVIASLEDGVMNQLLIQSLGNTSSQPLSHQTVSLSCSIGAPAMYDSTKALSLFQQLLSLIFEEGAHAASGPSLDNAAKSLALAVSQMDAASHISQPISEVAPNPLLVPVGSSMPFPMMNQASSSSPSSASIPTGPSASSILTRSSSAIAAPVPEAKSARTAPSPKPASSAASTSAVERGLWDLRRVTIRHEANAYEFQYSPLNNTPPTLAELTENVRMMFRVPLSVIVRLRDTIRGTIIDSDTDLADCFQAPSVQLELLLPPPPLHASVSGQHDTTTLSQQQHQQPQLQNQHANTDQQFQQSASVNTAICADVMTAPGLKEGTKQAGLITPSEGPKFASVVPCLRYSC